MKRTDLLLPRKTRGRIQAAEILLSICQAQMRNPDPSLRLGMSEFATELQEKLETFRQEAPERINTDNPEAAAVVAGGAQ